MRPPADRHISVGGRPVSGIGSALPAPRAVEAKLSIKGVAVVTDGGMHGALVKAVASGHAWFDDLLSGRAKSINAIAAREGVTPRYVPPAEPGVPATDAGGGVWRLGARWPS